MCCDAYWIGSSVIGFCLDLGWLFMLSVVWFGLSLVLVVVSVYADYAGLAWVFCGVYFWFLSLRWGVWVWWCC